MSGALPVRIFDDASFSVNKRFVNGHFSIHWHSFYEIELITDGESSHTINGNSGDVGAGDIIFLSPVDFHEYHEVKAPGLKILNIHFKDDVINPSAVNLLNLMTGSVFSCGKLYNDFLNCFIRLEEEYQKQLPLRNEIAANILESIIFTAARSNGIKTSPEKDCNGLPAAIQYIEHHFREQLSLDKMAEKSGFSSCYFSRIFHSMCNKTFQEYLLEKRLLWAARLLCSTDLPVTEVMLEAGFNSHSYFCRQFKKRFGVTPSSVSSHNNVNL